MAKRETNWIYTSETEAQRIIFTAHQICNGFYKANNFIVVPYGMKNIDQRVVPFPNLNFSSIPRFWDRVKKIKMEDFPYHFDKKLVEQVKDELLKYEYDKPQYNELSQIWQNAQNEVLDTIEEFIPNKKGQIKAIRIHPTSFGTSTSFKILKSSPGDICIFIRNGSDLYILVEAILTSIIRYEAYRDLGALWNETELLVDWIVEKSKINDIIKKYQPKRSTKPTMSIVRSKQSKKLLRISSDYYKKLGIKIGQRVFTCKKNAVYANGEKIRNLTAKEETLLSSMVRESNKIISFEKFSDILGHEPEDYSLYAITKVVQRLRSKLEASGVASSYVQTVRGEGYILKN